ncbi:MAG: fatty acid--CoA ligase family protein [Roseobacter sp.]
MKQQDLYSYIACIDPDRVALVTPQGSTKYGSLTNCHWAGAQSASVVVFCREIEQSIRAMIALDGSVASLCILPSTLSTKDVGALLALWNFDTVITDADVVMQKVFKDHGLVCVDLSAAFTQTPVQDRYASTQWLVPTSGTTSAPKLVVHTFQSLARVGRATHKIDDVPQVWGMLYDITRFAGYQVFFQALLSGHTLAFASLESPMDKRISFFSKHNVAYMSATPTLWRKILMAPTNQTLSPVQITLGGEAADQPTLDSLSVTYPDARITHIYASTEAGVGLAVSDGRAGFPTSYLDKPHGGVEIKLSEGMLFVRSAIGPMGYAGDKCLADADGWVNTGDLVSIDTDRFYIIGRESGIINVGGDKVVPEQVRDALLACEIVRDALVYGKKNPFTGGIVAADIVLNQHADQTDAQKEIDDFLALRLSKQQRPRFVRFVQELEITSAGKAALKK